MNIQIDNTGFVNKGAELMLSAIVDKYRDRHDINCVFRGAASYEQKASLGLHSLMSLQRFKFDFSKIFPDNRFENLGIQFANNIDYLFDAGGFHIGDQWINDKTTKFYFDKKIAYYNQYKKNGTKIFFLPQAVGPFNNELSKYYFSKLFEIVDVFIARDKISHNACKSVVGESSKLQIFPDFTNAFLPKKPYVETSLYTNKVCVIPNSKMLTHTSQKSKNDYLFFLDEFLKRCNQDKIDLFFLNHEGKRDLEIIKKINQTYNYPILDGLNANDVKYVIGKSRLVLSSRFHGVVSGLSQNVPTFCTSWSHKYEELMSEYDMDGIINFSDINGEVSRILDLLKSDKDIKRLISHLEKKSDQEKKRTQQMWLLIEKNM